jgi:hypothetical protein
MVQLEKEKKEMNITNSKCWKLKKKNLNDATPKLLDGLNCESKGENSGRKKSWGTFLGS